MKMKSWLTRLVVREDWASRALRLGLEEFDRENGGAFRPIIAASTARNEIGSESVQARMNVEAESVPTLP